MIKIPRPEDVIKTIDEQEQLKLNSFINDILHEINRYDGSPLRITSYKTLSLKGQKRLEELFNLQGWKISLQGMSDQRDGDYTNIILEAKL